MLQETYMEAHEGPFVEDRSRLITGSFPLPGSVGGV